MSRGPDAATLLSRRLRIAAEAAGLSIAITAMESTPWASATFNGARHKLTMRCAATNAGAVDAWLAGLPEADLPMRGHLLADLAVIASTAAADGITVQVEALSVEER